MMAVFTCIAVISIGNSFLIMGTEKERISIFLGFLAGGICAAVILIYHFRILPKILQTRKMYKKFISGKILEIGTQENLLEAYPETHEVYQRVNEWINREKQMESSNRQAKFLALQNQINPHFLYNTLEAIRGDALEQGMESLASTTEALAAFFRYTISNRNFLVTVEDELINIQNYFQIQRYRFGDELSLNIRFMDSEAEIRTLQIPKLTLQPIIENSVFHGLEKKREKGCVSVTFDQTEKYLFISIKDTGIGISEKELDQLNESLNETTFQNREEREQRPARGSGIALKNVSQRIKLIFGEEYGLNIYSTPGIGTNVKILLPRLEMSDRGSAV